MADFETALRARLIGDAAVAATGAQVDWGENARPRNPRIRLTIVSDTRLRHMTGPNGHRPVRVQIDCMADTSAGKAGLRRAVLAAIEPSGNFDGVRIGRPRQVVVSGADEAVGETSFVHRDIIDLVLWTDG